MTDTATPAIDCEALDRRYGSVTAVDAVSFQVGRGEFFALLGPNGAGKTTTVHMLTTLVTPSGGSARVLGCCSCPRQVGEGNLLCGVANRGSTPGPLVLV